MAFMLQGVTKFRINVKVVKGKWFWTDDYPVKNKFVLTYDT